MKAFFSFRSCRRFVPSEKSCHLIRRAFSSAQAETHTITCGSSGTISVEIFNNGHSATSKTPLTIYLPSSPSYVGNSTTYPPFLPSHTIARVNYRWNCSPSQHLSSSPLYKNHPFPTPLHDVMHAYMWLTTSLSPSGIYIYGSQLGGTLATSLALTESRSSRLPPQIKGLIVKDAVFDWTGIATSKDPNPSTDEDSARMTENSQIWTTETLHKLKSKLFSQPSQCFDSFASPLLFFRTAGLSVPTSFPGMKPPPAPTPSSTLIDNFYIDDDGNVVVTNPPSVTSEESKREEVIEVSRKSPLKFPPPKTGLRLPRTLIFNTVPSIASKKEARGEMTEQAKEMVHVMRRSILLHESKERSMFDDSFDAHTEAENRIRYWEIKEDSPGEEEQAIMEWLDDEE